MNTTNIALTAIAAVLTIWFVFDKVIYEPPQPACMAMLPECFPDGNMPEPIKLGE